MKKFELGEQPHTMTVYAQAIWNKNKGVWEVDIVSNETCFVGFGEKYSFCQSTNHVEVEDCDEFVIADALLHTNGIDVQALYSAKENPILG